MKRFLFLVALCVALIVPSATYAQSAADLSIDPDHIRFSEEILRAGETIRIYASISNDGDVDTTAYAFFYQGATPIGQSQVVTLVAEGEDEEVWTDFTVPYAQFNIRVEIRGTNPQDQNAANDVAITGLFVPLVDDDDDGVADESDNCPEAINPTQTDTNEDGEGDACDTDDDADGLTDGVEEEMGTDPISDDTDGDGVTDAQDAKPLDPAVTRATTPVVTEEADTNDGQKSQTEPLPESDTEEAPVPTLYDDLGTTEVPEGEEEAIPEEEIELTGQEKTVFVSPNAMFVYQKLSWKEYEFEAILAVPEQELVLWDFGDGSQSMDPVVTHTFKGAGSYTVTLTKTSPGMGDDMETSTDEQVISISFFHLSNPFILVILGLLLLLIVASFVIIFYHRKRLGWKSTVTASTDEAEEETSPEESSDEETETSEAETGEDADAESEEEKTEEETEESKEAEDQSEPETTSGGVSKVIIDDVEDEEEKAEDTTDEKAKEEEESTTEESKEETTEKKEKPKKKKSATKKKK